MLIDFVKANMGPKLCDFDVISVVGTGTSGTVRKVQRISDGKVFVWKELHYANMMEQEKLSLVQEVNLLRELRHPHIVRFLQHIVDKRTATLYIIMEHCPGGDLQQLISRCRASGVYLEEVFVWRVLKQLCEALRACHTGKRLVLHRDIKPANVFLDQNANIKLGDFGLARTLSSNASFATSFVGTPYYMSPEVVDGREYNERSDLWSLGCLVFELCALHPPFTAPSHALLAAKIRASKFERIPAHYSDDLWEVIQLLLTQEDFLRPTALMILYHSALRSYTSPAVGANRENSPLRQLSGKCINGEKLKNKDNGGTCIHSEVICSLGEGHRYDAAGEVDRGEINFQRESSRYAEDTVDKSACTVIETPTGRYAPNGCHTFKARKGGAWKCSSNSSPCSSDAEVSPIDGCGHFYKEDFFIRRAGKVVSRPLSRISEADADENEWVCTPTNMSETVVVTPLSSENMKETSSDVSPNNFVEEDLLQRSLCPRVLLAAREKARAEAIAKQNEGTHTMNRNEIDNPYNMPEDHKLDKIIETVCKVPSSQVKENVTGDTELSEAKAYYTSDDDVSSDSLGSVVSVRSVKVQPNNEHFMKNRVTYNVKSTDPLRQTLVTTPIYNKKINHIENVARDSKDVELSSLQLGSCVLSSATDIALFASPIPVRCSTHTPTSDTTPKAATEETTSSSATCSSQTEYMETSFDILDNNLLTHHQVIDTLSRENTKGTKACACEGMSKHWKAKVASLREAEVAVRARERRLNEREREVLKREKRALAMEQDARQHLTRAQIFLRQSRGKQGKSSPCNSKQSPSRESSALFPSPALVNALRYGSGLWSDTTTVSADAGDSSVVLTAAVADPKVLGTNPFLQMRRQNRCHMTFNIDPCVAGDASDAEAVIALLRDGKTSNVRDNNQACKKKRLVSFSRHTPAVSGGPPVKGKITKAEPSIKKPATLQLKVRSNNIFSSFRSGNKINKDEKEKAPKASNFRIPLLPSKKGLKKLNKNLKAENDPLNDKENVIPSKSLA